MSEEVFELLCSMDRRKVELQIVLQCAPVLSKLKTSNLLILPKDKEEKARALLRYTGLWGYRLAYDRHRVVFLVFNKDMLTSYLKQSEVKNFLQDYGYEADSFGKCLHRFQSRYEEYISNRKEFPHEMGVFLGYPLCDVKGFIENEGEQFAVSGYWKVYDNASSTKCLFKQFDDVKDDMVCQLSKGLSINEIAGKHRLRTMAG